MKHFLFTTILFFPVFILQAQIIDFPDPNFKNVLLSRITVDTGGQPGPDIFLDLNGDGEIQVSEAEAVTIGLYVGYGDINSLEGIEYFTNLIRLSCDGNNISDLDLSQNTALVTLLCPFNDFTFLDISNIPSLRSIDCSSNNINNINLNSNSLEILYTENNELSSINVSNTPNLSFLACFSNNLTSLDVTNNPNLVYLGCFDNQISHLDISQNFLIDKLSCRNNDLSYLNINNGNNLNFEFMRAENNPNLLCIQVDDEVFANNRSCAIDIWCKDATASYSGFCELGVEDNNLISFNIYPNPVQDVLYLESQRQLDTVRIYNLQGQLVNEISSSSIDVSELTSGLYFVQVTLNGHITNKKFIKE